MDWARALVEEGGEAPAVEIKTIESRDEQEITGYAEAMNAVFRHVQRIDLTEVHIRQLHRD